jgi:hypothetical protein
MKITAGAYIVTSCYSKEWRPRLLTHVCVELIDGRYNLIQLIDDILTEDDEGSRREQYRIDYALDVLDEKGLLTDNNRHTVLQSCGDPLYVSKSLIVMTENGLLDGTCESKNRHAIQEHRRPTAFWILCKNMKIAGFNVDQRIFDLMIQHSFLLSHRDIVWFFDGRPVGAEACRYIFDNIDTFNVPRLRNFIIHEAPIIDGLQNNVQDGALLIKSDSNSFSRTSIDSRSETPLIESVSNGYVGITKWCFTE